MIPYVIEQSRPDLCVKECNIISSYHSSEKDELNENIMNNIVDIMYEFCSYEYGYGIKIISYEDFCYQYWKIKQIKIDNLHIFNIKYFENDWKHWNLESYKEDIYIMYVTKYGV
jgi:hypothetical protein